VPMQKGPFYMAFRINLYCDISNCIVPFNANLIEFAMANDSCDANILRR
jgi:hypothetical protein